MKLVKKMFAVIIAGVMMFTFMAVGASAKSNEETEYYYNDGYVEIDGIRYYIDDDGAYVTGPVETKEGYIDYKGVVNIPSSIKSGRKTYTVYAIGDQTFESCDSLTGAVLPDTITYIGHLAFSGSFSLENVEIPSTCVFEYVAGDAFADTKFEEKLHIDNFTVLGENVMFSVNGSAESISLENPKIDFIADNCFANLDVKSISLPQGIKYIGNQAFFNCTSLTSVNIPDATTYIDEYAFGNCTSLTSLSIGNAVEFIGEHCFDGAGLTSVTLPASVEMADGAFMGASKLQNIFVNEENDFYYSVDGVLCSKHCITLEDLEHIKELLGFTDEDIKNIDLDELNSMFGSVHLVAYPAGRTADTFDVPDDIEEINMGAFYKCYTLKTINLSDSVDYIGDEAFEYCTFSSFDFKNVEYIRANSFKYCTNLSCANLENVSSISECAFVYCDSLTSVSLSDSLSDIGDAAFQGRALADVYVGGEYCWIGESAFNGCENLKTVELGEGVTYVGMNAFLNCPEIETITLSKTVEMIDDNAFSGCENALFKVTKFTPAYYFVKNMGYNFEIIGSLTVLEIIRNIYNEIVSRIFGFISNIFPWIFPFSVG